MTLQNKTCDEVPVHDICVGHEVGHRDSWIMIPLTMNPPIPLTPLNIHVDASKRASPHYGPHMPDTHSVRRSRLLISRISSTQVHRVIVKEVPG